IVVADLHHGAEHDEMPVGAKLRNLSQQLNVETLVNHSGKADAGMRDRLLVGRFGLLHACLLEMFGIDGAWEGVSVAVLIALGFVEALSPGEDQVGALEQFSFSLTKSGRSTTEGGKFVHAV